MPKEELKTLKDLKILRWDNKDHKIKYFDSDTKPDDKAVIFLEELRQEAIKDIKYFRKNRSSNPNYSKQELNGIEKYIMWKFNITGEELEK